MMRAGSSASGDKASSADYGVALEYLRDLESGLRYWYQAADTKAQVVLAIDGVILAILGGSVLTNRADVVGTVTVFGPETWVFLAGMAAAFSLSIACAVACLVARSLRRKRVREALAHYRVDPSRGETYQPEVTAFSCTLRRCRPSPSPSGCAR